MRHRGHLPLFALALAAAAAADAHAVVIDDYTVGPLVVDTPGVTEQTGLSPDHVIGGQRHIEIGQYVSTSTVEIAASSGMQFSSVGWGYMELTYDGGDSLGGIDLTAGGDDRFLLNFGDIGPGFHPLGIYVNLPTYTSKNGRSIYLLDAWDGVSLELPFSALPTSMDSVDGIVIDVFRNPAGTSFTLNSFLTGQRSLPGDFNHDGVVGALDLATWSTALGVKTSGGYLASADANEDGVVDGRDFLTWQRAVMAAPVNSAVPEPAAALLATITLSGAALASLATRGRRRQSAI